MTTGKLYSTEGIPVSDIPDEKDQQLMNAVLDGMITWDQSSGNNDFYMVELVLIPKNEKIPANVNFSD